MRQSWEDQHLGWHGHPEFARVYGELNGLLGQLMIMGFRGVLRTGYGTVEVAREWWGK